MIIPRTFAKDLSFVLSKSIATTLSIVRYIIIKTCHLALYSRHSFRALSLSKEPIRRPAGALRFPFSGGAMRPHKWYNKRFRKGI